MKRVLILLAALATATAATGATPKTERIYLSGHGSDDKREWDFRCSEGMNSGVWSTIGVPSCWETEGFGNYQYGIKFYGKPFPEGIAKEVGEYRYQFKVPRSWRGQEVRIVFEASMTDTEVKINGQSAGDKHQGGFYRFDYDISQLLNYGGTNRLEVTVAKESSNASVNLAERRADYWNFGGIIRPVYVECKPVANIVRVAIDAKADGSFAARCYTANAPDGAMVEVELSDKSGQTLVSAKGLATNMLHLTLDNPQCWTAETPNLYTATFTLTSADGKALHTEKSKFGFRTIEVRPSDGLYLNGTKIIVKGINRHSFRPESGRTLNRKANIEDVELIKSMNMNAVRLSHYPADQDFYSACDSLGLYVLDELGGWHGRYDTATGKPLIESMIKANQNHPSIIIWDNGNEGGWNTELDGEFHIWDLQRRPVIHPQGNFGGFETMHYRSYGETQEYMRKPEIFMPTEFLHGLYDGGHGAGLDDYWTMMMKNPRCAGGFLWVMADEGVVRTDKGGMIDNQGNYAADGIVGPHHEKEGSYYTVKQIWSPLQIKYYNQGYNHIIVNNLYDFTNASECTIEWQQVKLPTTPDRQPEVTSSGRFENLNIAPHSEKPYAFKTDSLGDCLYVTAHDYRGMELWRWSFPVYIRHTKSEQTDCQKYPPVTIDKTEKEWKVTANGKVFRFDTSTGLLAGVETQRGYYPLTGPHFVAARRGDRSMDGFYNHDDKEAKQKERIYLPVKDTLVKEKMLLWDNSSTQKEIITTYKQGALQLLRWIVCNDGTLQFDLTYNYGGVIDMAGITFDFPSSMMRSKRWLGEGPYRVWQNRTKGTTMGVWQNDYNDPVPGVSFDYPEFKGYFANVKWIEFTTDEGRFALLQNNLPVSDYIGVYAPRDGEDRLLYTLPETGISILKVIPPVRNKVNTTDLNGPSAQPKWINLEPVSGYRFTFE